MFDYLFQMQDAYLFVLLTAIFVAFSLLAVWLVNRLVPHQVRYENNAMMGNMAALISVIYGVLAGLTALYLITNNSATADAVQREANATANIYRDSKWLQEPSRIQIQAETKNYLTEVIGVEWPLMQQGKQIDDVNGNVIIDHLTDDLVKYNGASNSELLLVHDMLDEIRDLYNARQQRINLSYSQLSPELWTVILMGTLLTLFITYLFGMHRRLHIFVVLGTALMTSSMIFLLIALDRPFQGEFAITPVMFQSVLAAIQRDAAKP